MSTRTERWAARRRKLTKDVGSRLLWPLETRLARDSLVGNGAILERSHFPWLTDLEARTKVFRRELDCVLQERQRLPLFHDLSPDQRSISRDDRWRTYFFRGFGRESEDAARRCPETTRFLREVPGLVTAFHSILAPGAHIPRHRGIFKGVVRVHLALKVPEPARDCRMWLDGQLLHWKEGEAFVFDDTMPHEVWNDSAHERVVLLLDVVRPLRAPTAWLNRALLAAIAVSPYVTEGVRNARAWERSMRPLGR